MFRTIAISAIIAAPVLAVLHGMVSGGGADASRTRRMGFIEKALYGCAILSVLALIVTGFWDQLALKRSMTGYALLAHVSVGGAFTAILALVVIGWSDLNRFGRQGSPGGETPEGAKACFWAVVILGLIALVPILVSMLPIFGSHGLEVLHETHRYSALALSVAAFGHLYFTLLAKRRNKLVVESHRAYPPCSSINTRVPEGRSSLRSASFSRSGSAPRSAG